MLNRVTSLLIGKDISRDAQVVAGAQIDTITLSSGLQNGEIVVLDKDRKVLAAGATIADSDTIFIVQSTADTFDYTNKAGTAIAGARKIKMSGPIVGATVKNYNGEAYEAKSEQTASITIAGMTPAVGTEYVVRLVYKDVPEHPGQFTQTYRIISTTATLDTFGTAIAAKINKHAGRRVNATYTTGTDVLLLTAREIPENTSTISDIDKFKLVEFTAYFNYVNSSGVWTIWPTTSTDVTYVSANYGSGNWEQIRDIEKDVIGYRGVSNLIWFPAQTPTQDVVLDATYNLITIEHEVPYQSPDNQYVKNAPQSTVLAFVVPSAGTQQTSVLAQLNPWLASCPGAFANVSL